jgi:hypothetical protein
LGKGLFAQKRVEGSKGIEDYRLRHDAREAEDGMRMAAHGR